MYGWVPFVYLVEFGISYPNLLHGRCALVWSGEAYLSYSLGALALVALFGSIISLILVSFTGPLDHKLFKLKHLFF